MRADFAVLRSAFPNAKVKASTFDAFYEKVNQPAIRSRLPIVQEEAGDT